MKLIYLKNLLSIFGLAALSVITYGTSVKANTIGSADHTPEISQINSDVDVQPGRSTRSGSSYVGVGGNIGLTGDTPVGDGSFAILSKIGLTNSFSARPGAIINDDVVFLIPVTIDFNSDEVPEAGFSIAPYLGGGVAISTEEDNVLGGLITGGLDVPLSPRFTANTSANVTFMDDTAVGLQVGVGYNFQE